MPTNPTSTVAFRPSSLLAVLLALIGTADLNWFRGMAAESPVEYANPLVGTAPLDDPQVIGNAPPPGEELYTGFTLPGPALPHHEVILGPINKDLSEAAGNHGIIFPYTHARRTMIGFSSPQPGLTVMPLVGDWTVPPDRSYASVYDKASEKASPGYYRVYFPDHKIKVELTTTEGTGFYCFTFPKTERGVVLLDLGAGEGSVEVAGDRLVRGRNGRGRQGDRCFVAEFSQPFKAFGTFRQDIPTLDGGRVRRNDVTRPGSRSESGSYAGGYLEFSTAADEPVLLKLASGRTFEEAQQRLEAENPGWDFNAVKKRAEAAWSAKLGLIEVQGGTEHDRKFFYSALYHSFSSPRLVAKKGQPFRGSDSRMHTADYDRYTPVPYWDTGRDQVVLLTLLEPDLKLDVLRSEFRGGARIGVDEHLVPRRPRRDDVSWRLAARIEF